MSLLPQVTSEVWRPPCHTKACRPDNESMSQGRENRKVEKLGPLGTKQNCWHLPAVKLLCETVLSREVSAIHRLSPLGLPSLSEEACSTGLTPRSSGPASRCLVFKWPGPLPWPVHCDSKPTGVTQPGAHGLSPCCRPGKKRVAPHLTEEDLCHS